MEKKQQRSPVSEKPDKTVSVPADEGAQAYDTNLKTTAETLVRRMTLREKAALCSGRGYWYTKAIKRIGLNSVMMTDGPHGLRRQGPIGNRLGIGGSAPATCFPTASLTACSFDRNLLAEIGRAIAEEATDQGISLVLGPGVNIKRSPLCGRNFEYFSEDPYLSGELGAAFVRGVQGAGVGACLKHLAANSQEKNRMVSDSTVDERTLRCLYLPAFENVVKNAKPASVMCSYNMLNGTYASENKRLLTDILRGEWGYEGLVVSDWGATADRAAGIAAGLDLEMPGFGNYNTNEIIRAVKSGKLDEAALDTSASRVAALALRFAGSNAAKPAEPDIYDRSHELARRAAAESAVLLRNDRGALPLKPDAKLAVIGAFAKSPRYQGAGSSAVNPTRLDCAWDELLRDFPDAVFAPGYDTAGPTRRAKTLINEAVEAARRADTVVLFAGLPEAYESEGFDRETIAMPEEHAALIREVCAANPNTAIVIQAGAPVDLTPAGSAAAILCAYLGGQAGGSAIADILTGRVNPSGRLAETFPIRTEDTPCHGHFGTHERKVIYNEGIFAGYRHYEAAGIPVAYPFGHGLSYTTFEHKDRKETDLGGGAKRISVTVTNTGDTAGAETVLFYDKPGAEDAPRRELRGFEKIFLKPGESATVTADITASPLNGYSGETEAPQPDPEAVAGERPAPFDANSTLGDIKRTPAGFILYYIVRFALTLVYGTGPAGTRMTKSIVDETPLRTISTMSGNILPRPLTKAITTLANIGAKSKAQQQ
jgi:beta-glucosidase